MNYLDQKINEHFSGLVVRKDLVKTVKGNAIVPTYVLEYLLGQYCATSDEANIQSGIDTVKEILRKHYVHRNEDRLIKSMIREKGLHKVIDRISVELNEKADVYEASFSNLGIKEVLVDADTIKKHPKLLVGGVWCIADIAYRFSEDPRIVPWILESIKPIQLSQFDFELYLEKRKQFSLDEWMDLLLQSIGFNPALFDRRGKLLQLMRLVPYCERNYNLIELGPKGTGKSHIYSDFSPHGILISGGEVTVPKLFVNNVTGRIGLVGYWDTVAFDEFAGRKKVSNKELVDILKNYMANKSFSRGIETLGAEASLVFVGNTKHDLAHMLKYSNLFEELPVQFYDSAFMDRLHFYIPGWEVEIIRGEMFTDGYGFVVDYLAEILRSLRNYDYSHNYTAHFELFEDISTRDRDGITKTFSGLMKILFPDGEASEEDMRLLLEFAMEGRKRVKDQLMRIDDTFSGVTFGYLVKEDESRVLVRTLEEGKYPQFYYTHPQEEQPDGSVPDLPQDPFQALNTTQLDVQQIIRMGEGPRIEFKSTLRWNLEADREDKKIEHGNLKTMVAFLNSEGGTLLIGVEDNGNILGIEHDLFENEDKFLLHFGNLMNAKIGRDVASHVKWELKDVAGSRILRVDCLPSPTPVYLKHEGSEEFFIRNGPASVQLPTSEVVKYTKKHFR
jgi:ATP-dependent Lon protease